MDSGGIPRSPLRLGNKTLEKCDLLPGNGGVTGDGRNFVDFRKIK